MNDFSDFRSDTVTKPTEKMRECMANAVVGDDVIGDDPTVQELEQLAASIVGKEATLFMPSGTMGNAIAVKAWTQELDEVIVEERSHIYNMESTHLAFISRVQPRPIPSNRGTPDINVIETNIKKPTVHLPRTSLICLENTHNNWSGSVLKLENFKAIRNLTLHHNLKLHLDGARIFNAVHATGVDVKEYGALCDSIMFCLSKGLSAPVGSMLAGPKSFIDYGRRLRKALGGAMRQSGILAAAGIVALTEMVDRIKEDNQRAKHFASEIEKIPGIILNSDHIDTNIVIFDLDHPEYTIPEFIVKLYEYKIKAFPTRGGIRFVTHNDVDDSDIEKAIEAFKSILC